MSCCNFKCHHVKQCSVSRGRDLLCQVALFNALVMLCVNYQTNTQPIRKKRNIQSSVGTLFGAFLVLINSGLFSLLIFFFTKAETHGYFPLTIS